MTRPVSFVVAAVLSSAAVGAVPARAQSVPDAVLALPSTINADARLIESARLYGGLINAVIFNGDGTATDFSNADFISFLIAPRNRPQTETGPGFTEPFGGNRDAFAAWAREHTSELLRVLFPGSLSASFANRDTAQVYSQQFLLATALGFDGARGNAGRGRGAGALLEFEQLSAQGRLPGDSSYAWQGLYAFNRHLSVQGRLSQQREAVSTRGTSASVDYHPFREVRRSATWRVGASARGGFQYAHAEANDASDQDAMRLGSIDAGGGGWVSVRKDFRRMRIGAGTLLEGNRSFAPAGDDDTSFRSLFAKALNDRGIDVDLTYGGTFGYDTTRQTAVTAKYVQTSSLRSGVERPDLRQLMTGLSYALAPGTVLSGGYKVSNSGGTTGHSLFFQGNFGW